MIFNQDKFLLQLLAYDFDKAVTYNNSKCNNGIGICVALSLRILIKYIYTCNKNNIYRGPYFET